MYKLLFCYSFAIGLVIQSVPCVTVKLRKGYLKCQLDDSKTNECLLQAATLAIPELVKGVPEFGIPSIDPLNLGNLHIDQSSANLQLVETFTNLRIYGLSKAIVDEIKIDKKIPSVKVKFHVPTPLIMNGTYNLKGRLLVLPLVGKGLNINTFYGFNATTVAYFKIHTEKNNELKWQWKNSTLDFDINKLHVNLENLFNGDKRLSDNMNNVINENWNIFYEELKPAFKESIHKIYTETAKRFFEHININDAFSF